jgi:hypothetical protein
MAMFLGGLMHEPKFLCNLGISFLVPYTKDFGRITQF